MTRSYVKVLLGGPWYGSKVDARLAQSIGQFCALAEQEGVAVLNITFEDGMLDLARNRLLSNAIAAGADWLVSVDSDCSFREQYKPLARALHVHKRSEVALFAAPVKQGSGAWNVLDFHEQRLAEPPTVPTPVGSVGFGFVAFRCGWYATHWPRQDRHFVPFFQTVCYPDRHSRFGMGSWGEDFGHCKAVRDRQGTVVCDPTIRVPHHVVRPGHPASADE